MSLKRMLLEIGMGNDLHGGDYTKAAVRAMQDAMHHSSLSMIRSLGIQWDDVNIFVTIGCCINPLTIYCFSFQVTV